MSDLFYSNVYKCKETGKVCMELQHKLTGVSMYREVEPEAAKETLKFLECEITYHYLLNGVIH
ncbi:MAG: hypothetical protein BMS9Abin31_0138 [Gammaproteobacteria bacterium]|nr:MAG: hypothetical protein BMS9Abin31_0138 [Gammaproteobacteria bacterium]